jgi:hypothetical protein
METRHRILTLPLVLPWYSLQISLTLVAQVLVMVEVSPKLLSDRTNKMSFEINVMRGREKELTS